MSNGISVFNASVDYEYLFRDACSEFKVPCFDFPILFSTFESVGALLYDLMKVYRNCLAKEENKEPGPFDDFFQSLEYISHNVNILKKIFLEEKDVSKVEAIVSLFPDNIKKSMRGVAVVLKAFTVRKLSQCSKTEQPLFYDFVNRHQKEFARYAKTLSPLEGAASTPNSVKKVIPIFSKKTDPCSLINWRITTFRELKYAIKLCSMFQSYPQEVLDNLVRHLMCNVFDEKIRNSSISYYLFLKNPSLKFIMTPTVMERIFRQDYDYGYCSSSIARRLYIEYASEGGVSQTDAKNLKEAMKLIKSGKRIGNLFEIIYAHKDDYDADSLFKQAYLSNIENVESFLCEAVFAVKNSAYFNIPLADWVMSECKGIHGTHALYDFLGAIASLGFESSDIYEVGESMMGNLPIFITAKNDFEKDIVQAIFSPKHKDIHTTSLYDFYKNINPYVRSLPHMRKYPCFAGVESISCLNAKK